MSMAAVPPPPKHFGPGRPAGAYNKGESACIAMDIPAMKAMLEYTLGTVGKPHELRMNATVSRHLLEVAVLERPATAPSMWKGIEQQYSVEGVDQVPIVEALWFVGNAISKKSAASGPMADGVAKVAAFLMLALRRSGPGVKAAIASRPFDFSPREMRLSVSQLCIHDHG